MKIRDIITENQQGVAEGLEKELYIPNSDKMSDEERHAAIMKKHPEAKRVGKTPGHYRTTQGDLISGIRGVRRISQGVTEDSGPTEQAMDQSISDLVKDALGTRPTSDWMQRWMAMSADKKLALYQQLASQLD